MQKISPLFVTLFLTACVSAPQFDLSGVNHAMIPKQATTEKVVGQRVLWGGMILSARNEENYTRLEVLAFPTDNSGFINQNATPLGRFYADQPGYLETAEYKKGRWITVIGTLAKAVKGKVGEASYRYPVVKLQNLHLWSEGSLEPPSTQFHFGIGIRL